MAGTPAGGAARFSCPPNFIAAASEPPRFSLEALTDPDTELWLIQAPVDFVPSCLNGRLVPLAGSQLVKGKVAGKRHRYRVLSSGGPRAGDTTLLAPSAEAGGDLTCAPAPQGNLRIVEGPQEATSGILQPIPASSAPQIPEGLRPRFCAFGGNPPVTGPGAALALRSPASGKRKKKRHQPEASEEPVNGHGTLEVDAAPGVPEMVAGKKRKRKKEQLEGLEGAEPVATESPETEVQEPLRVLSPVSPKKKKKKHREAETAEPTGEMLEPDRTREEPRLQDGMELLEAQGTPTPKKKKRRKGTEGVQPGEGVPDQCQLQQTMEPSEEAVSLPSPKKKNRKEKGCPGLMEPGSGVLEPCGAMMELEGIPPAQETLPLTKKRKKDKRSQVSGESQEGMQEPELPSALEPQTALSPAKRKERRHKVTEAGPEAIEPEPQPRGEMAPEEGVPMGREKKRKKKLRPDPGELVTELS